ncbi:MAG: acetolactate synthase small subunit [Fibrobacterota bacterium]|jgi:acetolactate synthase-1/3 small subunit|nr:acetolactate synthase small subunit [Chitinispirillaceae bacterium]
MSTRIIGILLENHSGALSRVAGLFSSRGYNITSLTVAETDDPTISRMTIVVDGEANILEQIVKQLNRLIDVIKVIEMVDNDYVERELVLVQVDSTKSTRHEIIELASMYNAKIAAVSQSAITLEIAGAKRIVEDFVALVKPYGIRELVRSGTIALSNRK